MVLAPQYKVGLDAIELAEEGGEGDVASVDEGDVTKKRERRTVKVNLIVSVMLRLEWST